MLDGYKLTVNNSIKFLYLSEASGDVWNADVLGIEPVMGFLKLLAWYIIKSPNIKGKRILSKYVIYLALIRLPLINALTGPSDNLSGKTEWFCYKLLYIVFPLTPHHHD